MSSKVVLNLFSDPVPASLLTHKGFSLPAILTLGSLDKLHISYRDSESSQERVLHAPATTYSLHLINNRIHAVVVCEAEDDYPLTWSTVEDELLYRNSPDEDVEEPTEHHFLLQDYQNALFYTAPYHILFPVVEESKAKSFSQEYDTSARVFASVGGQLPDHELRTVFSTLNKDEGYDLYYLGSEEEWEEAGHEICTLPINLNVQSLFYVDAATKEDLLHRYVFPVLSSEPIF